MLFLRSPRFAGLPRFVVASLLAVSLGGLEPLIQLAAPHSGDSSAASPSGYLSVAAADEPAIDFPRHLRGRFAQRVTNRRDNGDMLQLFRQHTDAIAPSVVQVLSDGVPVSLGVVVSGDGYVITKRSQLSGDPIRVRLPDGRLVPGRVAAVRRASDLALVHIDSGQESLQPLSFAQTDTAPVGSFLITVGRSGTAIGLGVLSVPERQVQHNGRLGVRLVDEHGSVTVGGVVPLSGAADAGVKQGDQIIAIDGRNESTPEGVVQSLRDRFPGESVRLTINREGETLNLVAKIQDFSVMQESENDSKINGPRSVRLSGFERVLQHDTVLNPDACGSPLIDSQGRVVGLNIARAGRVVSYALPAALVQDELTSMLAEVAQAGE